VRRYKILIIEDEPGLRFSVREFLKLHGYWVDEAETCQEALRVAQTSNPDIVISDYLLPDGDALELLPYLKRIEPNVSCIILTGHGSIDIAVRAIKAGAEQFLVKPVELPTLLINVQRLLVDQGDCKKEPAATRSQNSRVIDPFLGTSLAIRQLAQKAKKLATTESTILIQGETGTGKGVLANWLHMNSPRREGPFVDLNCATISRELLETEIFGHKKGAFTGAIATKLGLFEAAHGGTIYLDEIGDMDLQVQPKLLKVLEERKFRRLGDIRERQADARLITATHKNLALLAIENRFREDLYFRISTFPLKLPPLRERIEDIPILARRLLSDIAADLKCGEILLSPDVEKSLQAYPWPGNIRELRNVLERSVILCENHVLTSKDIQIEQLSEAPQCTSLHISTLLELECLHIEKVLQIEKGRVDETAKRLGISRSALYEKIKKHGIKLSEIPKSQS
jgi:DNA-binding NtrC family response regulator